MVGRRRWKGEKSSRLKCMQGWREEGNMEKGEDGKWVWV